MKRISWKYLAGLIDGEGCIDIRIKSGVYITPRLRIAMTLPAKEVLDICKNSYGGILCKRIPRKIEYMISYSWELDGYKKVCPVLRNIVRHTYIKKEQIRLLLWMETHIKGTKVSAEALNYIHKELKLMKKDPHRLSEQAQEAILAIL